jgi:alkanesulfonate monooxygenase
VTVEVAWFSALCDDDYEFLGVSESTLRSSFEHCGDIVRRAERHGFDNVLLPSGYELGIDATAFAAGIAATTSSINLLLAVRCAELWPPQLARQLATIDQMGGGRLTVNIISSDLPGAPLASAPRYRRTTEVMQILRTLLSGHRLSHHGEFFQLDLEPPRVRTVSGRCPPFYFGGLSDDARACAAAGADVYLMWPDTMAEVSTIMRDMTERASKHQRALSFGYRVHVVVRETESAARDAAELLLSRLDDATGDAIRAKSLDSASVGVRRQAELREAASTPENDGYIEANLWAGIGRARSGCGAAIVGDPDQVLAKLNAYERMGIRSFILSGYPHQRECDMFARYVLPHLHHAKIHPSIHHNAHRPQENS